MADNGIGGDLCINLQAVKLEWISSAKALKQGKKGMICASDNPQLKAEDFANWVTTVRTASSVERIVVDESFFSVPKSVEAARKLKVPKNGDLCISPAAVKSQYAREAAGRKKTMDGLICASANPEIKEETFVYWVSSAMKNSAATRVVIEAAYFVSPTKEAGPKKHDPGARQPGDLAPQGSAIVPQAF